MEAGGATKQTSSSASATSRRLKIKASLWNPVVDDSDSDSAEDMSADADGDFEPSTLQQEPGEGVQHGNHSSAVTPSGLVLSSLH